MITELAKKLEEKKEEIEKWFTKLKKDAILPIYSSFDIRNAGYKTIVVDSNVFPSGFNNLCDESCPIGSKTMKKFIEENFPNAKHICLIAELVKTNPYYNDNIHILKKLIQGAGYSVTLGTIDPTCDSEVKVESKSYGQLILHKIEREGKKISVNGVTPELIILNNDLSTTDTSFLKDLDQPIAPRVDLGWFQRKKQNHFKIKEQLIKEVAEILDIDVWQIGAYYDVQDEVNFKEKKNLDKIAKKIDDKIQKIQKKYAFYNIKEQPYVFVKGSSSTYGMSVLHFHSGKEFLDINAKKRAKMHKSKGGREVNEVLIQEGVATIDKVNNQVAEPVIYCIGDTPIGGFFRTHSEKSAKESLSSGSDFIPNILCPMVEDNQYESSNVTKDHITVYRFLARLGVYAIGCELKELQ